MLNICVVGHGTLAAAVRECVEPYHRVDQQGNFSPRDLVWMCEDTPITPEGEADYPWVIERIDAAIIPGVPTLVSSQMPVGTMRFLEQEYPDVPFAYCPENIRVAHAVSDFRRQARIVVGRRTEKQDKLWYELLRPFTNKFIWTDPETAEMVKHALNAWLGMNIAFINEIARLASPMGATMAELEDALLSERRISKEAPLHAGKPFGEGHLARELHLLSHLSAQHRLHTPLLDSILPSNS